MGTKVKTFVLNHFAVMFFIAAILVSILFIGPAHAQEATIFSSPISTFTGSSDINYAGAPFCIATRIKANATSTVNSIQRYLYQTYNGTVTIELALWNESNGDVGALLATSSLDIPYSPNESWRVFTIPSTNLSGGQYYWLGIGITAYHATGKAGSTYIGGHPITIPSAWSGSQQTYSTYARDCFTAPYPTQFGTKTADWTKNPILINSAPPSSSVSLYAFYLQTPEPGAFGAAFEVSYGTASSSIYGAYENPYYTIDITAGNTPATFEGTLVGRRDLTSTTAGVIASTTIPTLQSFIPGYTYWAQADLYYTKPWGSNPVLKATSSIFSFTVSTTTYPGTFPSSTNPFPTSTISTGSVCNPDSFFLLYGICRLFVPQASDFFAFNAMKGLVQNKPPFGWVSSVVVAFGGISSGSSTVSLPNLSNFSAVFGPLDTGLASITWLVFIFWLFGKARHLEL